MSDKELVKTIVLSNNDRFYFSRKYDENYINKTIVNAEKRYAKYDEHLLFPEIGSQLEEDFRRKSIHGTVAIEGNPLTEAEVGIVLKNKDKKSVINSTDQEVLNIDRAYEMLDAKAGQIIISENDITSFHCMIMQDIDNNIAGKYRNRRVKVGDIAHGGVYTPPIRNKDIKLLMKEFINFINSPEVLELNPVVRGALGHYHLALIHPFEDGNGRMARIIEALIMTLSNMKYMPKLLSYHYNLDIDGYYKSFSKTEKSKSRDITDFLMFVCITVYESLFFAGNKILEHVFDNTLKSYFLALWKEHSIDQRQYELMQILLKNSEEITFKELLTKLPYSLLYRNLTDRTARRDILKLIKLNLIYLSGDGEIILNRDILKI
ncbi:Fic family protein [Candidatus Latescibacterota bacterium]